MARACGVRKSMRFKDALEACPDLVTLDYDFKAYDEVSGVLESVLGSHGGEFEQVSCDEGYVLIRLEGCGDAEVSQADDDDDDDEEPAEPGGTHDVINQRHSEALVKLAQLMREEIEAGSGCTASVGVGRNKLLAKLCTEQAKPDKRNCGVYVCKDWRDLLGCMGVREIHGIGRKTEKKLKEIGITTVYDVWQRGPSAEVTLKT